MRSSQSMAHGFGCDTGEAEASVCQDLSASKPNYHITPLYAGDLFVAFLSPLALVVGPRPVCLPVGEGGNMLPELPAGSGSPGS